MGRMLIEWEEKWELVDDVKRQGGQGVVRKVKRRDNSDPTVYALKELKQQRDTERRARMRREIVALETIPHNATPKVFDHNTDKYQEVDVSLFAVFEFIEGSTLSEVMTKLGEALKLNDALTLVDRLLSILLDYHSKSIGHRDIKPDNIILRSDNCNDPVLVDFGLSFNVEDENIELTYTGQQVGNRFLSLPEHAASSGNKRDLRSDITYCVGILFYCLTNIEPNVLNNELNQLPHQRAGAKEKLASILSPYREGVLRIFDIGFNISIGDRWQTIEALRDQIESIRSAKENANNTNSFIQGLAARARGFSSNKKVYEALENISRIVQMSGKAAAIQLGVGYRPSIEARIVSMENADAWVRCGIDAYLEGKTLNTYFNIRAIGDEIVIEELNNDAARSVLAVRVRIPISATNAEAHVPAVIVERIIANVSQAIAD